MPCLHALQARSRYALTRSPENPARRFRLGRTNNNVLQPVSAPLSAFASISLGTMPTTERARRRALRQNPIPLARTPYPPKTQISRQVRSFPIPRRLLRFPPAGFPAAMKLHRPLLKARLPWVRIPHAPNPVLSSTVRALAPPLRACLLLPPDRQSCHPDRIGRLFLPLAQAIAGTAGEG